MTIRLLHGPGWYAIVCKYSGYLAMPSAVPFRTEEELEAQIHEHWKRCSVENQYMRAPEPHIVGPYATRAEARKATLDGPNARHLYPLQRTPQ